MNLKNSISHRDHRGNGVSRDGRFVAQLAKQWIPAIAGMTESELFRDALVANRGRENERYDEIENLKSMIIEIRGCSVLLDSDVAQLYGVETKRTNEAVKNNPDKFPQDYMFVISMDEFADLRSKISTAKFAKTRIAPKAFTEKGLYMLATILHSKQAIEATFAIIEIFAKLRELSRNVKELSTIQDKTQQKALMQRSGELIAKILDDDLQTSGAETSIELNFAVLKFKHTVKKSSKK